jgi:hypothetical protein
MLSLAGSIVFITNEGGIECLTGQLCSHTNRLIDGKITTEYQAGI